jgi:DNA-binding MarR family transcriptional regulator
VDGLQLFVLGRRLTRIAERSFARAGTDPPPAGMMLVLEDIATHPDSSIGEVTARTGFPQSHVSTMVAKFRSSGIVETTTDPHDGRRTLVRATGEHMRRASRRATSSIDADVAAALDDPDPAALQRALSALQTLAELLVPDARARMAEIADRTPPFRKDEPC